MRTPKNPEYLNASGEDFSAAVHRLLLEERRIYQALTTVKAEILEAVRAEIVCEPGRQPVKTQYTRWGQWQIVIDDKPVPKAPKAPKAPKVKRRTYAEYRAGLETKNRVA
jgi:hypothetical protein